MDKFLELTIAGSAVGSQYALIVLGMVVIYRASGILNFSQGGLVLLGGYMTYTGTSTWGIPFLLAAPIAVVVVAGVGALIDMVLLRRVPWGSPFAAMLVTLGLLTVIHEVAVSIWGPSQHSLGDPWGINAVRFASVTVEERYLWTIGLAAAALIVFFLVFQYSRLGLAMRATAADRVAAEAHGVNARRVVTLSWATAGAVAAVAGMTAGAGAANVGPSLGDLALGAFPAMILGGLESPVGAVVGGMVIGVTQTLTAGYQRDLFPFLGDGFYTVMPYIVMIVVLLVRPYGLLGDKEVNRA
jgi:branched-chain amino acid transport system permease protein